MCWATNAGWINQAWFALTGSDQRLVNVFSYWGIVLVMSTNLFFYLFVYLTSALEMVSSESEEAANILGAGTWRDTRFGPPVADGGRPENALTGTIWTVNSGTRAITVPASMAETAVMSPARPLSTDALFAPPPSGTAKPAFSRGCVRASRRRRPTSAHPTRSTTNGRSRGW